MARHIKGLSCLWSFLQLDDGPDQADRAQRWRVSALRIMLLSAILLCFSLSVHAVLVAMEQHMSAATVVIASFYLVMLAVLVISVRRPQLGAGLLLALVYISSLLLFTSIGHRDHSDLGVVLLYVLPLVAWIFFGVRWSLIAMAANCVPFLMIVSGSRPLAFSGIDLELPQSHNYLHALLFTFFNICIPLSLLRVRSALVAASQQHRAANAQLEASNALYRDIFEHAGGPSLICDADGRVLTANAKAAALFGRDFEQDPQRWTLADLLTAPPGGGTPMALLAQAQIEDMAEGELTLKRPDGGSLEVAIRATPLRNRAQLLIGLRDLSQLRRVEAELAHIREQNYRLASHDRLTGLPNREHLRVYLQELMEGYGTDQAPLVAVASIRLNSARATNEKYGVTAGDQLIRAFAAQLQALAGDNMLAARLHGVVFSVAIAGLRSAADLEQSLQRLWETMPAQLEVAEQPVAVTIAGGVAFCRGELSADELLRRSEQALEAARKAPARGFALFNETLAAELGRINEIEIALSQAIARDEFTLVYQPKVRADGAIAGLEALLRWQSQELGTVSPGEFIPIAERCGRIQTITDFVADRVCAQLRRWQERFGHCWPVAINLSGPDLQRHELSALLADTAARHGIAPGLLEVEITETGLVENGALALRHLGYLKQLGFAIALDDFGTGHSSLEKLGEYPITLLKIDLSFIAGIGTDPRREQIILAILALARSLNCQTVAEGVESTAQFEFLRRHGCDIFQGYLFHRPLAVADIDALLAGD